LNIVYTNIFGPRIRAHAYKYFSLLKDIYGGKIISGRRELDYGGIEEGMKRSSADLFVISGQNHPQWKVANKLGIPYVLCQQDVWTLVLNSFGRTSKAQIRKAEKEEKEMIEDAEGIIFTSEDHKAYCESRYDLPSSIVVHLKPFKKDITFAPRKKLPGRNLVLSGCVMKKGTSFSYKAYHEIFKNFIDRGWKVHILTPSPRSIIEYIQIGCETHSSLPQHKIYEYLSQFDAGFVGYGNGGEEYIKTCRPNKLWEYLGAGIPTVALWNVSVPEDFHKWGIQINTFDEINNLDKHIQRINFTDQLRFEQTIDEDKERLKRFFDCVLESL